MNKQQDLLPEADVPEPPKMPLKHLGDLDPCEKLLVRSLEPGFQAGEFTQSGQIPAKLKRLLKSKGLEVDEDVDSSRGMLFASSTGVLMHSDDRPSVLWVLSAGKHEGPQLVCGDEYRTLVPGEVLFFDARKPHGVIVWESGYWVVLSMYVKPLKNWDVFVKSN